MSTEQAPALKEIFNSERLLHIASEMRAVYPDFDSAGFLSRTHQGLDELSIMQRLARVSESLHAVLPLTYKQSLKVLRQLAPRLNSSFVTLCLPHYVASYGAKDFDLSMEALKYFTTFGSAEFAIRHFLLNDFERTLAVMESWALDTNEHVRRLASEGSRPRLPWSFRLARIQADPSLAAGILDRLKTDDSLYVRKSVANHLNDITKEHPDWVLELIEGWSLEDPRTAWIARHALRSLIKQGNPRALTLMGAGAKAQVEVLDLKAEPAVIHLGDSVTLSFTLTSTASASQKLVIDYGIDYVKANGGTSTKVFKLKTLHLAAGASETLSRRQHIRELTTRKHYSGHHAVHLLINGERLGSSGFDILE
ncbi:DNA alkylation repair protein [Pseudomonas gingeri]|uniref:DNA alkylation repair protein n=1 Tax=Pseudomonas gingeri TaxID=117681 RepID=A0A7Y8CNA9_9PSED|nr:DNA alkylation repair protein [Pseudomonas gingeri]NWB30296.1 DNA alkylation repair protein [Pseudomonas gingeri]NWC37147.1 DNA alkylation repair protein [Pseudomonas gingeri]NWD05616.1 DNA alkylation repair protein [Pseudomonas gingeri]NWD49547.1 DNA alkylation repair protein [Pseudomonas gingeri]NWE35868.1 DNA alkylation repair protein [Pseudomonas gingeri]